MARSSAWRRRSRCRGSVAGKVPANLLKKMHGPAAASGGIEHLDSRGDGCLDRRAEAAPGDSARGGALGEGYEAGLDAELIRGAGGAAGDRGARSDRHQAGEAGGAGRPMRKRMGAEVIEVSRDRRRASADAEEGHVAQLGDQIVVDFNGNAGRGGIRRRQGRGCSDRAGRRSGSYPGSRSS